MTPPPAASKTPLFVVICAWIVVAIPLGWGLYQSVVKSRPLFTGDTAPAAAPAR